MKCTFLLSALALVGCWINGVQTRTIEQGISNIVDEDSTPGELWAVLVAGSSGWYNYRHQADVCHAYQILHQHGVPDDHIIVMMYDDIGNNTENPTPGIIINQPGGPNVYEGVLKDYTGDAVTPKNFLNILKGNSSAMAGIGSGKVVNSTHRDRIFINLVDHGAPGLFAFPDEVLHATKLAKAIIHLHHQHKFKEMVIYVEACESGSMFKNLLPDYIKVYALSASSPHEPSYACYMDDERETYLGDVFSVKWMEDTDREDIHHESIKHQYQLVKKEVTTSRVMQWGEHDISRLKLWEFMGEKNDRLMNSVRYHIDTNTTTQDLDSMPTDIDIIEISNGHLLNGTITMTDIVKNSTDHIIAGKPTTTGIFKESTDLNRNDISTKTDKNMKGLLKKTGIVKESKLTKSVMVKKSKYKKLAYLTTTVKATRKDNHQNITLAPATTVNIDNGDTTITEEEDTQGDPNESLGDDEDPCISSAVASPDVPVAILESRVAKYMDDEKAHWKKELGTLHMTRLLVEVITYTLVKEVTDDEAQSQIILQDTRNINQWDCYDLSVDAFHKMCFNLGQNPYALRLMQVLVNLCEYGYTADKFLEAANKVCIYPKYTGIH